MLGSGRDLVPFSVALSLVAPVYPEANVSLVDRRQVVGETKRSLLASKKVAPMLPQTLRSQATSAHSIGVAKE